jgi:sugar phosphate isomerase/epimerase
MLRIFTFTRVAEPESLFPRTAEVIGESAVVAEKDGVKLLIENEASQNAGTSAETAKLIKLLPHNVGINGDSLNGLPLGEKPFRMEMNPSRRIEFGMCMSRARACLIIRSTTIGPPF